MAALIFPNQVFHCLLQQELFWPLMLPLKIGVGIIQVGETQCVIF